MSKNVVETKATNDTIWRKRVASRITKATRTRMHTPTCPGTHTHPPTHTHTHTHTHIHAGTHAHRHAIDMEYLPLLFGNNDSRTRLNVKLYAHCLSCYYLIHDMRMCFTGRTWREECNTKRKRFCDLLFTLLTLGRFQQKCVTLTQVCSPKYLLFLSSLYLWSSCFLGKDLCTLLQLFLTNIE